MQERVTLLESSVVELQRKNVILQTKSRPQTAIDIDPYDITLSSSDSGANLLCSHVTTSTSSQTTETVFSPCCHCFATHLALASAVQLISEECSKLELHSELASTNWSAQAEVGGLDLVMWSEAYQLDIELLQKNRCMLEEKMAVLVSERDRLKERVCLTENESAELREQMQVHITCKYH